MEQPRAYTLELKTLFREDLAPLQIVSRRRLLAALDDCLRSTPENRPIRLQRLKKACQGTGLEAEALIADPSRIDTLPTPSQVLEEQLPDAFYALYKAIPTSADYMARLVRRLAPEYANDPVRLAILKKAAVGLGRGCKSLSADALLQQAEARLTDRQRAEYRAADEAAQVRMLADALTDDLFEDRASAPLSSADILRCMARRVTLDMAADLVPEGALDRLAGEECLDLLTDRYTPLDAADSTLPEKLAQLLEAMNSGALTDDAVNAALDAETFAPLRRAFGDALKQIPLGTGGDTLYKRYDNTLKEAHKKLRGDQPGRELLNFAEDLADGWFRPGGVTLKQLYYFAFLFGLTPPPPDGERDPERDLEKNLFEDYYAENTLQMLLHRKDAPRPTALEKVNEVVSNGINWKSSTELCYLYWLPEGGADSRAANLTPGQRIDKAEKMIRACRSAAGKRKALQRTAPTAHTRTAQYRAEAALFFSLNEKDAIDLLVTEYVVDPGAPILTAADTNTAFELWEEKRLAMAKAIWMNQNNDPFGDGRIAPEIAELADKLHRLLTTRLAHDPEFCQIADALHRRLTIPESPFGDENLRRLLAVLHALSRSDEPLSVEALKDRLTPLGIPCDNGLTRLALETLSGIGFAIGRSNTLTKPHYYLEYPPFVDPANTSAKRLLELLRNRPGFLQRTEDDRLLRSLMEERLLPSRRVTRTEFVALYALDYMNTHEFRQVSLSHITREFRAAIDNDLEAARYQKLGSKNLFDVYILLLLFLYAQQDDTVYELPITYRLCGGENHPENRTNHLFGQPMALYPPTREGFRFVGWQLQPGAAPQPRPVIAPYDMTHYTVTAVWQPEP